MRYDIIYLYYYVFYIVYEQSFQVEGHKIGRSPYLLKTQSVDFLREFFKTRKTACNSSCYRATISIRREQYFSYAHRRRKEDENPDFIAVQLPLYCSSIVVYKCVVFLINREIFIPNREIGRSGDREIGRSGDREMFIIVSKIGRSPAKSGTWKLCMRQEMSLIQKWLMIYKLIWQCCTHVCVILRNNAQNKYRHMGIYMVWNIKIINSYQSCIGYFRNDISCPTLFYVIPLAYVLELIGRCNEMWWNS